MRERTLLVGTDMAARGDDAIVEALTLLAAPAPSALHILHAIEPGTRATHARAHDLAQEELELDRALQALRRRVQYDAVLNGLPHTPARIHHHVRLGDPVEVLLQACVDYDVDLLIVGTHGRQGLQRLLLGSVAEQLLRRARCPVLVARPISYHGVAKSERIA